MERDLAVSSFHQRIQGNNLGYGTFFIRAERLAWLLERSQVGDWMGCREAAGSNPPHPIPSQSLSGRAGGLAQVSAQCSERSKPKCTHSSDSSCPRACLLSDSQTAKSPHPQPCHMQAAAISSLPSSLHNEAKQWRCPTAQSQRQGSPTTSPPPAITTAHLKHYAANQAVSELI